MSDPRCDLLESVGMRGLQSIKEMHIAYIWYSNDWLLCSSSFTSKTTKYETHISDSTISLYRKKIVNWFPDLGKPSFKTMRDVVNTRFLNTFWNFDENDNLPAKSPKKFHKKSAFH